MKGVQVKANWANASDTIMYKVGRSDSWHRSTLQVADASHSKTKALAMVKRWLKSDGYQSNPAVKVKAIRVKNFTGTISNVRGRTVVKGRSKGR
jgi:hypothetical protein